MKKFLQNVGKALSEMVMPNVGAFIAWGLIAAFFLPSGWTPNATIAKLIDPMLYFLLPMLIGYTGGRNFGGVRGGVVGAIATIGTIIAAGASVLNPNYVMDPEMRTPMFLGAMIMGPLAGWLVSLFDKHVLAKVNDTFHVLVDFFSAGIIGFGLCIAGFLLIGGLINAINFAITGAMQWLLAQKMLPLTALIVEPAKVLFLNSIIGHGILNPVAYTEMANGAANSIFFMIEANPGPGFGMLMALWAFGNKEQRLSAPGAAVIQFIGGIHELYFPYVLSSPKLILGLLCGSASSLFFFNLFDAGLVAPAAPGSIIAYLTMTPPAKMVVVVLGELIAIGVSFIITALLLGFGSAKRKEKVAK